MKLAEPGAAQSNLITLTEPNVSSPPVRSRSTWYEATVMSAERTAASSRVRFDVTGCPFVLFGRPCAEFTAGACG